MKIFVKVMCVSLGVLLLVAAVSYCPGTNKIPICHASASSSNPFTNPDVDYDSIVKTSGHNGHTGPLYPAAGWGDIIPSFWWHTGDKNMVLSNNNATPPEATGWNWYGGLNWPAGTELYNNGCAPLPPPPVDLCSNIAGNQETMPAGYEDPDGDKVCTLIPPILCSSMSDWTLVGDTPEWVVASDLLSRTKTFNYAKYDLIYQGVCDTKTETITDIWATYCLNGITGHGWLSELPVGAIEGACGTRPVCTGQGTIFIDIGAPLPDRAAEGYCGHEVTYCLNGQTTVLKWDDSQQAPQIPEGATLGACVPVEPQPTPIPPPVTGGSGGPGSLPLMPIVGIAGVVLIILGLAMKPRKVIGPTK